MLLTIHSHPEDKERHAVELSSPADREPKASLTTAQLHSEVLIILS